MPKSTSILFKETLPPSELSDYGMSSVYLNLLNAAIRTCLRENPEIESWDLTVLIAPTETNAGKTATTDKG